MGGSCHKRLVFLLILVFGTFGCGPKAPPVVSTDDASVDAPSSTPETPPVTKDRPGDPDVSTTDVDTGGEPTQVVEPPAVERDPDVDFTSIGCILPLSGRSRLVGETVLKGVMLGTEALLVDGERLQVTVSDSKGSPETAAEAVEALVENDKVAAIIGPLDGAAAEAAAQKAEELEVPILLWSLTEGVGSRRDYAFREFASNRAEVRALCRVAVESGSQRIAVFFPDNGYGRTMRNLMEAEAMGRGLEFAGAFPYDPKGPSFVDAAAPLTEVEFDTLFIPDRAGRIALVAPAVASAGLWSVPFGAPVEAQQRAVQLLIPSAGISRDLPRRAGRYLDGAVFASLLHEDASPESREFIERFELIHGATPSFLAGYGHDAVVLLAAAIHGSAATRKDIADWLLLSAPKYAESLPLAMPFGGFSEDGEPLAQPWLLQLIGGEWVPIR